MPKKIYNVLDNVSVVDIEQVMNISEIQSDGEDQRYFAITYFNGITQNIIISYSDMGKVRIPDDPHFGTQYERRSYRSYNRDDEQEEHKWWFEYREITEKRAKEIKAEHEVLYKRNNEIVTRVNRSFEEFRQQLIVDLGLGKPENILGKIDLTKQKEKTTE